MKNKLLIIGAVGVLALIGSMMNSPQASVQGAGGPTVTIDPTQLPLRTSVPNTELIIDQTAIPGSARVGPIDVSRFKEIRVVAHSGGANPTSIILEVVPYIVMDGTTSAIVERVNGNSLPGDPFPTVNKVYDVVAQQMQFDAFVNQGNVRVQVYGRSN